MGELCGGRIHFTGVESLGDGRDDFTGEGASGVNLFSSSDFLFVGDNSCLQALAKSDRV